MSLSAAPQRRMELLPAVWHELHFAPTPSSRLTALFASCVSSVAVVSAPVAEPTPSEPALQPKTAPPTPTAKPNERMRGRMSPPVGGIALAHYRHRAMPL